jgi:hypothetical protein
MSRLAMLVILLVPLAAAAAPTASQEPKLGSAPWGKGVRSGYSKLTVENGTETDAVVRLVRLGSRKRLVRNFYIPKGRRFTAKQIPPGQYVLRVAFGADWDRAARRFQANRSFSQTDPFQVTQERTADGVRYSRMRVTLHKVVGGNLGSASISEEDFLQAQE